MKFPTITIRLGADTNTATIDGREFDRSTMDRATRKRFNRLTGKAWRMVYENQG